MEAKKITKKAVGGVLIGAGYALKLAEWGLNASEVVLNGAKNMADSFVKAPELGVGKAAFDGVKKAYRGCLRILSKQAKGFLNNGT